MMASAMTTRREDKLDSILSGSECQDIAKHYFSEGNLENSVESSVCNLYSVIPCESSRRGREPSRSLLTRKNWRPSGKVVLPI